MLVIEKDKKTKTAVVCPVVKADRMFCSDEDMTNRKSEAEGLVTAMGQDVVFCCVIKLAKVLSGTFFGKGVIERLKTACEENEAELLVVDMTLTPVQQRNLEKALKVKVIDRTAVILEIFGRRAQTKEGKLQVELAHLTYQRGRLVRSWTHLERQRGGGGFLGGPGETQIELDRRHLDTRILKIKKELEKVRQTRAIQRSARVKVPYPVAALVGYTNAGKSTLFNYITKSDVFAKDMLFATLDPTMRKIELGQGMDIILSDTVGFISNLPHELVMAFRATLEEVLEADVILNVIDCANPKYKEQREDVLAVLHELGLTKIEFEQNYVEVFNKIDLLDEDEKEHLLKRRGNNLAVVSALDGAGVDELLALLYQKFEKKRVVSEVVLEMTDGQGIAAVYRHNVVLERRDDVKQGKVYLKIKKNV
ncbi:MAG: GTPase HflX [Acetobacter sp.]|nr:GTPase HflX [Acetobacter sp.]